jgi:hypothetical protein
MFRRRPGKSEAKEASAYSRRSAVADSAWIAQDRLRSGAESAVKGTRDTVGRELDRASFPIEKKVVWPLQDRAHAMGVPARAISFGVAVLLAAAVGVGGLIWAAPNRPNAGATAQVETVSTPAVEGKARAVKREEAKPTLHGAAPVFKPARPAGASEVDPGKAIVSSAPSNSTKASPAAAADSNATPSPPATQSTEAESIDGPPAGPAAVAVAHDFSDAFVVYETGGLDGGVRRAFGETATPELSRALLRRPPRLPANVEVPRAKVLNVVAGPSHDGVYAVSVSLLRVGVTSELRLDMEQLKGKEWRVTNVLG